MANFINNENLINKDSCYVFGGAYGNKYEEIDIYSNEPIHLFLEPKDIISGKEYITYPEKYAYRVEPSYQEISLENYLLKDLLL